MTTYATAAKEARDTSRAVAGLEEGRYLWQDPTGLVEINGDTLAYRCEQLRVDRGKRFYQRFDYDTNKWRTAFRREEPLYRLRTTTTAFWDPLIMSSNPDYVKQFDMVWAKQTTFIISWYTGRDVFGSAIHPDAGTRHQDVIVSRVSADGYFLDDTDKAWGLIGPDATGILRQVMAGFRRNLGAHFPRNAIKALKKFVQETARPPLDVLLGLETDNLCLIWFGNHPDLRSVFSHYDRMWKYSSLREDLADRRAQVSLLLEVKK
jgi:hypothetical protein